MWESAAKNIIAFLKGSPHCNAFVSSIWNNDFAAGLLYSPFQSSSINIVELLAILLEGTLIYPFNYM